MPVPGPDPHPRRPLPRCAGSPNHSETNRPGYPGLPSQRYYYYASPFLTAFSRVSCQVSALSPLPPGCSVVRSRSCLKGKSSATNQRTRREGAMSPSAAYQSLLKGHRGFLPECCSTHQSQALHPHGSFQRPTDTPVGVLRAHRSHSPPCEPPQPVTACAAGRAQVPTALPGCGLLWDPHPLPHRVGRRLRQRTTPAGQGQY